MTKGTVTSNSGHVIIIDAITDIHIGCTVHIITDPIEGQCQIKLHALAAQLRESEGVEKKLRERVTTLEQQIVEMQKAENK